MFKISPPAPIWRRTLPSRRLFQNVQSRRFLGITAKARKPRSWRSTLFRWALVAGGVYYYNTSDLFVEKLDVGFTDYEESLPSASAVDRITISEIVKRKKELQSLKLAEARSLLDVTKTDTNQTHDVVEHVVESKNEEKTSEEAGDSAGQEGAFDPETGTINWDCPCLGGMAHGPCGEEFKDAFSCFVHSKEEPKGVECIDRFKTMQSCFRNYPEIYGAELEDDMPESEAEGDKAVENSEKAMQITDQLSQSPSQDTAGLTDSKPRLKQEADNCIEENETAQKKKDAMSPS